MKNKNLFKIMSLFLALALSNFSFSQNEKATESKFADYAVGISLSLFGGAIGFTHNWNPKTSFQAALGGFQEQRQLIQLLMAQRLLLKLQMIVSLEHFFQIFSWEFLGDF